MTEAWGVEIQNVEMKNVEIPATMQRAMAQEAEALREKRARIIKAEAEFEAAMKLREAADEIMKTPASLELAPHADADRSGRRAEHHDHRHDAERIRRSGADDCGAQDLRRWRTAYRQLMLGLVTT